MSEVRTYKYYAGGQWFAATSGQTFDVHEPFSGELLPRRGRNRAEAHRCGMRPRRRSNPGRIHAGRKSSFVLEGIRNRQTTTNGDR